VLETRRVTIFGIQPDRIEKGRPCTEHAGLPGGNIDQARPVRPRQIYAAGRDLLLLRNFHMAGLDSVDQRPAEHHRDHEGDHRPWPGPVDLTRLSTKSCHQVLTEC
jgi:hypothetical protein